MADFILGRLKFKWQGDWTTATAYIVDDVVNYNGTSWICVSNHTAGGSFVTDRDADKWEPMVSGLHFAGEWDSATTYETNDVVQHAGSSWISVQDDNTNHTPTPSSSTYWDLLVQGDADSILTTRGDIIYRSVSASTRLPIGSNGAILQVGGGGGAEEPIWSRTIENADDIKLTGQLYSGTGATGFETTLGLTDVSAVIVNDVDAFAQVALYNADNGGDASTDLIVYADNGDNDSGWIDMGITSSGFTAAAFGLTGPNDGYIFMSAPTGTTGHGNLVLATDSNGDENDIVFATGGFATGQEKMRLVGTAHGSYNAGLNILNDVSTTSGKFYVGPNAKALTVDGTTASTQLNGGVNSTATTITVDSTTGFNTKGYITINSEVIYYGGKTSTTFTNCNRGYQGTTAASHADNDTVEQVTYVGLTNPTAIFTGNADDFVQFSIKNTNSGASASTDLIAYASDGDNDSGWIDLGITSSAYNDPAFTVTGPGTGYLFFSAPATTTGTGDLLIGTDHTGSNNDIVFFTNGFDAGNERVRIVGQGANAGVEVYADTESVSTTTGALRVDGGIGLQGNLYVGGDVNIVGNITLGGTGNTVETESLAVADPIIRMANGNSTTDTVDIGFVGTYGATGAKYTGLVRDATDSVYKLFTGMTANPTTTVDFTGATYASLKAGSIDLTATTASTTTTSGALTVAGGVGVVGAANIGGVLKVTDSTASTGTANGAVVITGGVGVGGAVNIGGDLTVTGNGTFTGGLRVQELIEDVTDVTQSSNTVTLDYSTSNIFYVTGTNFSANFTVNITNAPTTNGRVFNVTLVQTQGSTGYRPTTLNINGSATTIKWPNATAPTPTSNSGRIDIFSFTVFRRGSAFEAIGGSQLNIG